MNWFIFNDKNSKNLGILVNYLPPITKTSHKTETIEIEGKSGDIVKDRGYASYNKEVEITRIDNNIDVNDIIEWLDCAEQAKLVLSNEPNVYYIAQLVEQVDFARFENFETVKLVFHVQPFKYYLDEQEDVLEVNFETSLTVYNKGSYKSDPVITIEGSGKIELSVNGKATCTYTFPESENKVVLDSEQQDAYLNGIYKNRNMTGNFIELKVGENVISWSGDLTKISVNPRSRWR